MASAPVSREKKRRTGAKRHCCYGVCRSDSRYNEEDMFYFLPFPQTCPSYRQGLLTESYARHKKTCQKCQKCEKWLRLCCPKFGTSVKQIPREPQICSLHFVGESGPTEQHPDPIQCVEKRHGSSKKSGPVRTSLDVKYRNINKEDLAPCTTGPSLQAMDVDLEVESMPEDQHHISCNVETTTADTSTECSVTLVNAGTQTEECPRSVIIVNAATQTEECLPHRSHKAEVSHATQTVFTIYPYMRRFNYYKQKCSALKSKVSSSTCPIRIFEKDIEKNDKECFFYTGLHYYKFLALLAFLGPAVNNLNYWKSTAECKSQKVKKSRKLSPSQELLIVLMRLRRGFLVTDLGFRFNVSPSHVTNLTITWVQLMYLEFSKLRPKMFPSRLQISQNLPSQFKRLTNIRVLIDCAEFFCEAPGDFQQQGNLYSSYKAHTTFKVLFGCTPNGSISYVSDAYEGSISDREIFKQCGIIDLLEEGDLILADRGFNVHDLVESCGAHINIPPFLKGRSKLTAEEEIETKKIAKLRIYVEHAVGKVKTFRILTRVLPLNMRGMMSQIVFVCACLINFQPPILCD